MPQVTPGDELGIRSHEVQEIIGRPPHSLVQWGITVFFLAIVGLLLVSWFIRYPDLLIAQVTLTTSPPPITLVTQTSGNLVVYVADSAMVIEGQVIGCVKSTTDPSRGHGAGGHQEGTGEVIDYGRGGMSHLKGSEFHINTQARRDQLALNGLQDCAPGHRAVTYAQVIL